MIGYAYIGKDGNFIEGKLPEHINIDKFCIMCAAAFGTGNNAQEELNAHASKVIIQSEDFSIIIKERDSKTLLVVIGSEEDLESIIEKEGSEL